MTTDKADYWKSQAKKFCDFCKCWIADNKPSVGFHESGKRHKENVAKRLAEISKNSLDSHQESLQVDLEMKKMEEDALKAYMKDLQENPDFTSKRILEETEKRKKELEESIKEKKEGNKAEELLKTEESAPETTATTAKLWYEAKSDEGYTYYWNTSTSESVWEAPAEGFVSVEEQEKEAKLKEEAKMRKKEEKEKKRKEAEDSKVIKEQQNLKKKKRKKGECDEEEPSTAIGPVPKANPYGNWSTIEPKVEEPLDLELPQQEFIAIKVPELREPQIKFREKTVATLEKDDTKYHGFVKKEPQESSETFKKRKLNKGNVRQKLDTD